MNGRKLFHPGFPPWPRSSGESERVVRSLSLDAVSPPLPPVCVQRYYPSQVEHCLRGSGESWRWLSEGTSSSGLKVPAPQITAMVAGRRW